LEVVSVVVLILAACVVIWSLVFKNTGGPTPPPYEDADFKIPLIAARVC